MKAAGCWQMAYGVETGSQRLMQVIQKGITLEQVEEVFNWTKQAGLNIAAYFMLGLPTETVQESWQTIEFAKHLEPDWAEFTLTTPFPGTPLFETARHEGRLTSLDWSKFRTQAGWMDDELPICLPVEPQMNLKRYSVRRFANFTCGPNLLFGVWPI